MTSDNTTNAPEMVTLKLCPCCNSPAEMRWYDGFPSATCTGCGLNSGMDINGSEVASAARWNLRHQSASPSGLVEELASIVENHRGFVKQKPDQVAAAFDSLAGTLEICIDVYSSAAPATAGEEECPSCHGLNLSCPAGCGRDPETGELNGTRYEAPTPSASGEAMEVAEGIIRSLTQCGSMMKIAEQQNLARLIERLTQSPPPNDAVRELLREAKPFVAAAVLYERDERAQRKNLLARIDALLSAQPAPVDDFDTRNVAFLGQRLEDALASPTVQAEIAKAAALHPNTESGRTPVEHDGERGT